MSYQMWLDAVSHTRISSGGFFLRHIPNTDKLVPHVEISRNARPPGGPGESTEDGAIRPGERGGAEARSLRGRAWARDMWCSGRQASSPWQAWALRRPKAWRRQLSCCVDEPGSRRACLCRADHETGASCGPCSCAPSRPLSHTHAHAHTHTHTDHGRAGGAARPGSPGLERAWTPRAARGTIWVHLNFLAARRWTSRRKQKSLPCHQLLCDAVASSAPAPGRALAARRRPCCADDSRPRLLVIVGSAGATSHHRAP